MGCLLELFFEIFVEGIFELIGYCYLKLMQLIVPDKVLSEKAKKIAKRAATVIAALLFIILIIGMILYVQEDPAVKTVGNYMTYIPLSLIGLQIVLGIIVRIISHFKKS
ncbi:MAG: hypothetical protein IJP14_04110 [Clostridia bacterium]|nr:hypothetical protein [Clostridia bacterium]